MLMRDARCVPRIDRRTVGCLFSACAVNGLAPGAARARIGNAPACALAGTLPACNQGKRRNPRRATEGARVKQPSGYVIYQGASVLDGAPIVVIAITGGSTNRKTGDMVQTYILRADVSPLEALQSGADASICGDCKHRPALGGACYVNVTHGPRSVWEAWQRGNYPALSAAAQDASAGRMVRLGTYGDPMAVPAAVWHALTFKAAGHTGYTHQWANFTIDAHQRASVALLCMASVDNVNEAAIAKACGLRYFRVRTADEPLLAREFVCPASEEAGKRTTCGDCGACNGNAKPTAASAVIVVHGPKASRFNRAQSAH